MKNIDDIVNETIRRVRLQHPHLGDAEIAEAIAFVFDSIVEDLKSLKHPGVFIKNVGSFVMVPNRVGRVMTECLLRQEQGNKNADVYVRAESTFKAVLRHADIVRMNRVEYIRNKYGVVAKTDKDYDEDEEDDDTDQDHD